MASYKGQHKTLLNKRKEAFFTLKTLIVFLEIFIVALLLWWITQEEVKKSRNLLVLFLYSFPAEFLIALVPHEPILLYFGKFYPPLTVALVSIAGTSLAEAFNYSIFKYFLDLKLLGEIRKGKFIGKLVKLFDKAPFVSLIVAGFTPVPFYPFRFLVVLAHYPLRKYILAVIVSRTPRFYFLALLGNMIKIPDFLLIVLFVLLIILINLSIMRKFLKVSKEKP